MPSQYGSDALLGLTLGSNILALPNTIEQQGVQAQHDRDVLTALGPQLGLTPEAIAALTPQPAIQHFPGMNVPVLGSVLRGVGGVGQLLQTVLGNNAPAPRPPLAELAQLAQIRKAGEAEDRDKQRLGMEQQRLNIEQKNSDSLISRRTFLNNAGGKSADPNKQFVVSGRGVPNAQGSTDEGGGTVTVAGGGITAQEYADYQRQLTQKVRAGEMSQADANAQLFGLKEAMTRPTNPLDPTSAGATTQDGTATPTTGAPSGIRYGAAAYRSLPGNVRAAMAQLGVDPTNYGAEDVAKANALLQKQAGDKVANLQSIKNEALSAPTKTMIEAAPSVKYFTGQLRQALSKVAAGPFASRFQEASAGKIGASDPDWITYRTELNLLTSQLVKMHFGSRGGQAFLSEFQQMLNSAFTPDNMNAALDVLDGYADELISRRPGGAPTRGAAPPPDGGSPAVAAPSVAPKDAAPPVRQQFDSLLKQYGG